VGIRKTNQGKVNADDMQFGFTAGKETTDVTFTVRQMQEKHGNGFCRS